MSTKIIDQQIHDLVNELDQYIEKKQYQIVQSVLVDIKYLQAIRDGLQKHLKFTPETPQNDTKDSFMDVISSIQKLTEKVRGKNIS